MGGRLDILLKNPEDDSMFEVEVMLGDTDESHIIRTIEYWDVEKRRWPQRQHYAVLVAESITRRFFNVVQLLSQSIPIIAIQANIIEAGGQKSLNFVKVLDTFEEIDDGSSLSGGVYDEHYWTNKANWVIDTAQFIQTEFESTLGKTNLNFTRHYVSLISNGYNKFLIHKRSGEKILLSFRIPLHRMDEIESIMDNNDLLYAQKGKSLKIKTDLAFIRQNKEIFSKITKWVFEYWHN